MAAYISVPRDLTKVKSKVAFNLTKRQLVCFGTAALIGVPLFFVLRDSGGNTAATLGMMAVMLPAFFLGMYEKNGQPLRIELSFIGTDALSKSMAEIIQADMRQIGADVSLIGEEESSIYARQRDGRFGMIFNRTWGAPYDPHAFMSSMRVPSHADYQAQQGLTDKPLIDKEISEVLTTSDATQRQALYRDILTRLHDEAVYLPISYISMMVVSKPELGNIPYAPIATEIPFEQIKPVKP